MHTYITGREAVPDEESVIRLLMFYLFSVTLNVENNTIDKESPIN